jgi:pyridinium-3,5-biscarboxylic acid mononucleotide synthase
MNASTIREILVEVAAGRLDAEAALVRLRDLPFEALPFARIDHHRPLRQGFPEAILCDAKSQDEVIAIARRIVAAGTTLIATRVALALAERLRAEIDGATYNEAGRVVLRIAPGSTNVAGRVLVVTAGTADLPVAEEAIATLAGLGADAERVYDVGVAGIHRVLADRERLLAADVLIVVAGMEGALASVIGGLARAPVIAVPTSAGYGAAFGGIAALLGMLTSCAQGITVTNIDNGFGAACAAFRILAGREERARASEGAGAGGSRVSARGGDASRDGGTNDTGGARALGSETAR